MASNSDDGWWIIAAIAFAFTLYNCSASEEEEELVSELGISEEEASTLIETYGNADDAIDAYVEEYVEASRPPFDEYAARMAAEDELAGQNYDGSYGCTDDCSGHEAGWRWRADNGFTNYGNSNSVYEGGVAFDDALEARVDEMRNDYESGSDPGY